MLHCHLLVWTYGYNDFSSSRTLMDKTPEKYSKLASFLEQVIFNQVATLSNVHLALHGNNNHEAASAGGQPDPDPLYVPAKERLPQPPPTTCFPRHGFDRCRLHDDSFASFMYLDLAEITPGANLHKCQATCHKYNHKKTCR